MLDRMFLVFMQMRKYSIMMNGLENASVAE